MITRERKLIALVRENLYAHFRKVFETVLPGQKFMPNWHVKAIAWHLQQCVTGDIKRLIITMPPRYAKSLSGSVAFPTWVLGRDPNCQIICVSYSDSLSRDFSRLRHKVMDSDWYTKAFPKTRFDPNKRTESEIYTDTSGHCIATSTGGTLTGRGGNIIILDDPMKASDASSAVERKNVRDFYCQTLVSRLNYKTEDVIIIITQRLHPDDLVANVIELDDWTVLNLPAIATEPIEEIPIGEGQVHIRRQDDPLHPERESHDVLDKTKRSMGSAIFAAQYQQSPVPLGGNMIQRKWFQVYKGEPRLEGFERIVQSWDTAAETGLNNSYSACVTCGILDGQYYILDVFRDRLQFPELLAKVQTHARRWNATHVLIEDASSGKALIQSLRDRTGVSAIGVRPDRDKVTRLAQQSAVIEAGRLWLPEDEVWMADFLDEVLSFPNGKFDDQVDALTQLLFWGAKSGPPQLASRVTILGGGPTITDHYFRRTGVPLFR